VTNEKEENMIYQIEKKEASKQAAIGCSNLIIVIC
jgi:hypothetical protein